jgi:hypothetical protein
LATSFYLDDKTLGIFMDIKRFREQLKQQLNFIANSCNFYDSGHSTEAIRIGTSLRVLFHNTGQSTSLFKHLGEEQVPILSTCQTRESIPDGQMFDGLVGFSRTGPQPKLGQSTTLIELPAPDWWQQPVLGSNKGFVLSRKDIALTAANKDGGTHVDLTLPRDYEELVEGLWVNAFGGEKYINHHFLSLRQMGYEILNSPKLLAIADYKRQTVPLKEAVPYHKQIVVQSIEARVMSSEETKRFREEFAACESPILVPFDGIHYSSPCPFCSEKTPNAVPQNTSPIVEGDLPLTNVHKWVRCQGDTGHLLLLKREPIETIQPIRGEIAYNEILSKLGGNSLAKDLAKEVYNFYGEFLTYSESRESLSSTYNFDFQHEPSTLLKGVKIHLQIDTGREPEALAHGLLYLQLPIRGFPVLVENEIPNMMPEESAEFFRDACSRIQNMVGHEIYISNFKALGYLKRHFLAKAAPPSFDYKAMAVNTFPQRYDWEIGFSWWCLEYFRHWISMRHGQSLELQKYANDALEWGSELHPALRQAVDKMMEWVKIGEFKKPGQYIHQINNLMEIMKIPKIKNWALLENSPPQQQLTAKRIILDEIL